MESASTVEIQRKDEKSTYLIPVIMLSEADRKYLTDLEAQTTLPTVLTTMEIAAELKVADDALWELLGIAGSQATLQSETKFNLVLDLINRRLAAKDVKTASGQLLTIRTEPAELVDRIMVPRNMDRMRMDLFMREIARRNSVVVKLDSAGMVVLIDAALDNLLIEQRKKSADIPFYNQTIYNQEPKRSP